MSAAAAGRSEWRARVLDDASVARLGISRQAVGGQGSGAPPSSSSYSSSGGGPAGYHHVVKIMASTAGGGGSDAPDVSGGGGHLGYDGTPLARVVGALSRPLNVRLVPYSGDPVLQAR